MNFVEDYDLIDAQLPPRELRDSFLDRVGEMSMLPAIAQDAIRILKDPDSSPTDCGDVIQRDITLAAEILSLANSALFSTGGSTISTLEQAIVRLGFRQCQNLIISSSATCLMKNLPLEQEWVRTLLWKHSFTTATACSYLNRFLDLRFMGEEYAAGLLHDFGRLLLAIATPEQFSLVDTMEFDENSDFLEQEQMLLRTDHCQFGAWFAFRSGLPRKLMDVMRWHHQCDLPNSCNRDLVALTQAGDHIANFLQQDLQDSQYDPFSNPGIVTLSRIRNEDYCDRFKAASLDLLDQIRVDSQA